MEDIAGMFEGYESDYHTGINIEEKRRPFGSAEDIIERDQPFVSILEK